MNKFIVANKVENTAFIGYFYDDIDGKMLCRYSHMTDHKPFIFTDIKSAQKAATEMGEGYEVVEL